MKSFYRQRRWRSAENRVRQTRSPVNVTRRIAVLGGVVVVCFLALTVKLFSLQILHSGSYRLQAEGNRLRVVPESPARGLIFDRNGQPLATNMASFSIVVTPALVPQATQAALLAQLEDLTHTPAFEMETRVADARRRVDLYTPLVVRENAPPEMALIVAERRSELPGVEVRYEPVRVYPAGAVASLVLGYTGRIDPDDVREAVTKGYLTSDRMGKAGVEFQYEDILRGRPGENVVEFDAAGQQLRAMQRQPAQPGSNVTLTLDLDLQRAVTTILLESTRDLASKKAVAIVMDVRTGELLADVSLPAYDNNMFSGELNESQLDALTRNPDKPLLDHAIAEKFPPGSTFKIVTGLSALQDKVATPATTIVSNGALAVPREDDPSTSDTFPDWRPGLGALNFYRGLAMSSDVYFYCLAGGHCPGLEKGVGNESLARHAHDLGFGEKTGIDLPGETDGLVGDAQWLKRTSRGAQQWYLADTFYQGIGQGYVEATPLQVVRMTAAVANGGLLLRPRVVHDIRDAYGSVLSPARVDVERRVGIDEQNLATVREGMRQSVADGTAVGAQVPGVQIAGKTGTAEFGSVIGAGSVYGRYKEHGWFTGFAPFSNPEVSIVVFHEQGGGALTAAPTASRILAAYFDLKARRQSASAVPSPNRETGGPAQQ